MDSRRLRVGIAAVDFGHMTTNSVYRIHDPVQAVALVVESPQGQVVAVIVALDLVSLTVWRMDPLRAQLSAELNVPLDAIMLHTTHTHSSARGYELDPAAFYAVVRQACANARATARPADMVYYSGTLPAGMTCRRRWDSKTELGTFSIIGNEHCRFADGRIYIKEYVRNELRELRAQDALPLPEDLALPPSHDQEISLLIFMDEEGRTLGGIARAAAHVDQVAGRHGPWLSAEYPGALRRCLQAQHGGTFLYLNGPCGDVRPVSPSYEWEECERFAQVLSSAMLSSKCSEKRPLTGVRACAQRVPLPMRRDYPRNRRELCREFYTLRTARAQRLAAKLEAASFRQWDLHRWAVDWLMYYSAMIDPGEKIFELEQWPYHLQLIDFGGVASYLGLSEEVFSCATPLLRQACPAAARVQLVELCNGADWYFGPQDDLARGGYEPTVSIYAPGAFETMLTHACKLLAND